MDTAVQQEADLIIMTTHGRSGVSRWLMGSVTERVLRQTPCPILVVRDETIPDNIIITLDGSELAEEALLPGLALAIATQAEVTLLQVDDGVFLPLQTQEMLENKHSFAALYLQTVAERFSHHKLHKTVLTGNPAEAILNFADLLPNSLIVMSTHGRSGLARWVFGSVTEKIVRGAKSSVFVTSPLKIT